MNWDLDRWLDDWPDFLYVIAVVVAVVVAYVTLNVTIGIYADFAHAAAIDPSVAAFPKTAAALEWSALWMWFMPAIAGCVAIVCRFTRPIARNVPGPWRWKNNRTQQ